MTNVVGLHSGCGIPGTLCMWAGCGPTDDVVHPMIYLLYSIYSITITLHEWVGIECLSVLGESAEEAEMLPLLLPELKSISYDFCGPHPRVHANLKWWKKE